MKKPVQRIKLKIEGSPVMYTGTVMESAPDGKRIKVRFDGPLDDVVLYAFNGLLLDKDPDEVHPSETKELRMFKVLG